MCKYCGWRIESFEYRNTRKRIKALQPHDVLHVVGSRGCFFRHQVVTRRFRNPENLLSYQNWTLKVLRHVILLTREAKPHLFLLLTDSKPYHQDMIKMRRALEYLYISLLLTLAITLLKFSVGVIVTANTTVDSDLSTRDVGVAYLLLLIVPFPVLLSYAFYISATAAYELILACAMFGLAGSFVLFIITLSDNDPSCTSRIQVSIIGMVVSMSVFFDSCSQVAEPSSRKAVGRN